MRSVVALLAVALSLAVGLRAEEKEFAPLFPEEGAPAGWSVRAWNDLVQEVDDAQAAWTVKEGVLASGAQRGNWLMSDKEYENFELAYEFRLGPRGNSGLALRAPLAADPAFDGMEFQMADMRYNPDAFDSEITGGLYRALAPSRQVYRPTEWNEVRIRLDGSRLVAFVNDVQVHDVDLATQTKSPTRHDGSPAPPLKDRPRRGHLGFQNLSRDDAGVQIRNARIRELPASPEAK
ncbi:MAG TPA: DUF1080 domain-containing protein [Pirellulaceae bacterium]|jgi:hypothetical protein|nr:DUF1080 domain-containing protein [Pirellulaceae bacterium]